MLRYFFIFLVLITAGCNNNSTDTSSKKNEADKKDSSNVQSFTWAQEEEQEFLAGCIDSAKVKMKEEAAFAQCKCILGQLKQQFPNMDSAAPALMDVNRAAAFVAKCK